MVIKDALANGVTLNKYKNYNDILHWHGEHEIIFAVSGKTDIRVGNEKYLLTSGDCAFIESGEPHSIKNGEESEIIVIYIGKETGNDITCRLALKSPVMSNYYDIPSFFSETAREISEQRPLAAEKAQQLALGLIVDIYRNESVARQKDKTADEVMSRLKTLIGKIHSEFASVTFEDAVAIMGFSPAYFSKTFHRLVGMPFVQYLNQIKIENAVAMLSSGEEKISDIASKCGYNSTRQFHRVFKEITKRLPSEVKNKETE